VVDLTPAQALALRDKFIPYVPEIEGPTLEKWLAAGYRAEHYPPPGYAAIDSPALHEFRAAQAVTKKPATVNLPEGDAATKPEGDTLPSPVGTSATGATDTRTPEQIEAATVAATLADMQHEL
jgi:hypothetical protein